MNRPTTQEIKNIVSDCVSDMFYQIQEKIGQDDGGVAGVFYHGGEEEKIEDHLVDMFERYLNLEEQYERIDQANNVNF